MTPASRPFLLRLAILALATWGLASCSTATVANGGKISKVKYYHLVPGTPVTSNDPAIRFERDHHLYGAVTKAEIMDRGGHYYTIFWKADDRSQPVTVRFEYRQASTGLTSKVVEQEFADVRKSNIAKFQVTGGEYTSSGRVTAWKVTLMRGKDELASQESFLWN